MRGGSEHWSDLVLKKQMEEHEMRREARQVQICCLEEEMKQNKTGNPFAEAILRSLYFMQHDQVKWERECLPSFWHTKDVSYDTLHVMKQTRKYWQLTGQYDKLRAPHPDEFKNAEKRLRKVVTKVAMPPPPLEEQLQSQRKKIKR